ncbi:hypothetical protein DRO53_04110 [Candidatus Bathyarchaeota archaeon]|nr:MAG: hypothetical protein DRO53_04110 [Candidatus Bathyarchaeota archaeon]
MVKEVVMPKLSSTMKEGRIVKWLKKEGEKVQAGEPIVEIEAEKVTTKVEAPVSGTLEKILAPEGSTIPPGQPIALIREE